jgi:hypothetical protein
LTDLPRQPGNLASGLVFVNHTFTGGLMKNGNSVGEVLLGLFQRVAGHTIPDFLDSVFCSGLIAFVSQAPKFALPSAFKR